MSSPDPLNDLATENEHWFLLAEEKNREFMAEMEKIDDPVKLRAVIAFIAAKYIAEKKSILDIIAEET